MSNYSGLNILKSNAKELAKKQGIKLTEALEAIAIDAAFRTTMNFHLWRSDSIRTSVNEGRFW
ncbi:hypothetical protein RBI80_29165 (plasmid) [Klebsiella variicola]|nr:hypothetical protein RBI80_29165 [Klebsiella variicola]